MSGTDRSDRLVAEFGQMRALAEESSILDFESLGDPPEEYTLTLRGKGINQPPPGEDIGYVEQHNVLIRFGYFYPSEPPEVRWLTPIFHPNIASTGRVQLQDCGLEWKEEITLDVICERLWDLARGAYVDLEKFGNCAANSWFTDKSIVALPLDDRPLRDRRDSPSGLEEKGEEEVGCRSVRDLLVYGLSLPERSLRSASGIVGGGLRESVSLLVPQAFRNSKTYGIMVQHMLDFLAEDIGGVQRSGTANASCEVTDLVARKAAGNFIEMAGLATFHLSPLVLLAVVSDVFYGSHAYLKELGDELKRQGVIDQHSTIDCVDDLLDAVGRAAETMATAFDTPPLSVEGLKQTIDQAYEATERIGASNVSLQTEAKRLWDEIHEVAINQGVSPFAVSGAMTLHALDRTGVLGSGALSTVRAAGTLFDRHVVDHYVAGLNDIRRKGIYASLAETSQPYVDAVWMNFSTDKSTITEDLLSGKLIGQVSRATRRWLGYEERPLGNS